jgi:hypothetical protein
MRFFDTFGAEGQTLKHARFFSDPALHKDHFGKRQVSVR